MVETSSLLRSHPGGWIAGSNPALSAKFCACAQIYMSSLFVLMLKCGVKSECVMWYLLLGLWWNW